MKDEVIKQNEKRNFNQEFKKLVEQRVAITHKKIYDQNIQKKLNEDFKNLIEKRFAIVQKELVLNKLNQ